MSKIEYPEEIRVFPNSQAFEFDSEETFEDYLKEELPNRSVPGQYYFHSYSRLKNIEPGTLVLFRFLDMIKGTAVVGKKAVRSIKIFDGIKYEGYIILEDTQVLPYPLMVQELEELTGISFHQKGRSYKTGGRVYQKIPESKIEIVVDRINELMSLESQIINGNKENSFKKGFSNADPELGRLGEEFVLSLETERLRNTGKIPEKVKDGKGYDIRSWDDKGKEIHIEVKTTSGVLEERIFWTRNEHFKSQNDKAYWIYRVYEFDRNVKIGKIKKIKGSFKDSFDTHPSSFYGFFDSVRSNKRNKN
ncbi:MAG: DUF3883 domain-containing protein [Thermoplasmataceae archaeon]|jgi:hypothetical protein